MFSAGFIEVGGYEAMIQKYFQAYPDTTINNYGNASYKYGKCGIPPKNAMHLIRAPDDGSLPWPGIMFGLTISSVWYWCSDQVKAQYYVIYKRYSRCSSVFMCAMLRRNLFFLFESMYAYVYMFYSIRCF